jgi:hypothetical protein
MAIAIEVVGEQLTVTLAYTAPLAELEPLLQGAAAEVFRLHPAYRAQVDDDYESLTTEQRLALLDRWVADAVARLNRDHQVWEMQARHEAERRALYEALNIQL